MTAVGALVRIIIFEEGPSTAANEFTMLATVATQRHDGTTETITRDYVSYLLDLENGVTSRNSILLCSSNNIEITYV